MEQALFGPKRAFETPLVPCLVGGRQRRVGAGRGASLERSSAERADCPAVLGLAAASPNSLRSLRSLRSDSGDENDDERAARWPQALCSSAPQKARRDRPPHAFAAGLLVFGTSQPGPTRTSVSVGSGLELQHCNRVGGQVLRRNVAIQDLTPAPLRAPNPLAAERTGRVSRRGKGGARRAGDTSRGTWPVLSARQQRRRGASRSSNGGNGPRADHDRMFPSAVVVHLRSATRP